jgi:Flp pilus assembly protein TadG
MTTNSPELLSSRGGLRNQSAVKGTTFGPPVTKTIVAGARRNSRSGQVIVMSAVALVALMGFLALAVDLGQFWTVRRDMQTAADAAATAGAIALRLKQDATAAARSVTALNGFTDGNNNVTVTVNNPPAGGTYAGNSNYVEVIVAQPEPTYFMRVLGYSSVKVNARAVGSSVNSPACVYALDPTVKGALSVAGNSSVTLQCGAIVDSSDAAGLLTGGGGSMTATAIGVVGGYSGTGFSPTPKTGLAPAPDPLSYLSAPAVGACDHTNFHAGTAGNVVLNPGVYCGGIQISGNNQITFNPGVYILDGGGLKLTGSATLSGSGVTFYNTQYHNGTGNTYAYAGVSLSGSAQVNLSAPTSGALEGMLFFQDRSVPATAGGSTVTGTSNSTFDGAVYFSTTALSFAGNSSSDGFTLLVGDTVAVTGNSNLQSNYSTLADGSPIRSTALYE